MKKLIFTILLSIITSAVVGQTYLFKGNFDLKNKTIVEAAYVLCNDPEYSATRVGEGYGAIALEMNYGGYPCFAAVGITEKIPGKEVDMDDLAEMLSIVVEYNHDGSFDKLYELYKNFQSALMRKYGKPQDVKERFNYPWSFSDPDNVKMDVLESGEAIFSTTWTDDRDAILLSIGKSGVISIVFYNLWNISKGRDSRKIDIDSGI